MNKDLKAKKKRTRNWLTWADWKILNLLWFNLDIIKAHRIQLRFLLFDLCSDEDFVTYVFMTIHFKYVCAFNDNNLSLCGNRETERRECWVCVHIKEDKKWNALKQRIVLFWNILRLPTQEVNNKMFSHWTKAFALTQKGLISAERASALALTVLMCHYCISLLIYFSVCVCVRAP